MRDVRKLAAFGAEWSRRWGLVLLTGACFISSSVAGGPQAVTTVHLNCLDHSTVPCERLESGNGQILVEHHAILSDADFASVELTRGGPYEERFPILAIEFSQSAAETLWETTRESIGRKLIFAVDGYVVASANILEPVRGPRGQFALNISSKDAEDLMARIVANKEARSN